MTINDWGDAIFASLTNALNTFLEAIPQVIGALLILLIGWIIAGILARITRELLARAGADRLFAEHGGSVYGSRTTEYKPSVVASEIVKWIVRFIFLIAAANVLGMTQVSILLNEVLLWLPNLLVAAVILLLAPILARFVRGLIEVGAGQMGFPNARILGRIAEIAVMGFAILIAVNQLGIAADLINVLFVGIVAALALAFGLAFGLGGRDVAAEMTRSWYQSANEISDRVRSTDAAPTSAPAPKPRPSTTAPDAPGGAS
jgi:hypothetical protein